MLGQQARDLMQEFLSFLQFSLQKLDAGNNLSSWYYLHRFAMFKKFGINSDTQMYKDHLNIEISPSLIEDNKANLMNYFIDFQNVSLFLHISTDTPAYWHIL